MTGVRLRDGRSVSFGHDGLGRRATTTFPAPVDQTVPNLSYSYDLTGAVTAMRDGNGHDVVYGRDALGRVVSEGGRLGVLTSGYDVAGRRTRLTWGDGFFVTYEYDVTGAMTAVRENGGGVLASYGYDDLGRRVSRVLGNGTSTTYGHDAASRLTALNLNGGGPAGAATFEYNPAWQVVRRTQSNGAYAWNGAVNVERTYAVNGLNQYTQSGSVVPTYDGRGNLTSAGGATYLYNGRNQLSGANGTSLYYDASGRLDRVGQSGLDWEWDGDRLVSERSGGAIARRYVHGAGVDEPILWYEGSGTGQRRWLDADERGSIVRVTDDAGGVVALNTYDEHGIPGQGNAGRFQYTGQMWMPELGFYHYKARMYSPTLGRFLQPDPIGYGDGLNLYAYVGGDPVNMRDPTGTVASCGFGMRAVYNRDKFTGQTQTSAIEVVAGYRCETDNGEDLDIFNRLQRSDVGFFGPIGPGTIAYGSGSASLQKETKYLTNLQCNSAQNFIRTQGELTSSVGGAVTAAGLTAGTVSVGVGLAGAATGNLAAAFVGTVGGTASAAVTSFGGTLSLVGAAEQFVGGSSTRLIFRQVNNAIVNRLPLPSLAKGWIKEGLKKAESYVPDVRVCR